MGFAWGSTRGFAEEEAGKPTSFFAGRLKSIERSLEEETLKKQGMLNPVCTDT